MWGLARKIDSALPFENQFEQFALRDESMVAVAEGVDQHGLRLGENVGGIESGLLQGECPQLLETPEAALEYLSRLGDGESDADEHFRGVEEDAVQRS